MFDVKFFIKLINLSLKEDLLLKLYISKVLEKESLYRLLYNFDYDIEKETLSFNFLLADLFRKNPHIDIPKDIKPRLMGIMSFFQYYNANLLLGLKKLVSELDKYNIYIMLVENSAMRLLDSGKEKMMFEIECVALKEDFFKVIEISKKIGFEVVEQYADGSVVIKQNKQVIIIHNTSNKIKNGLYEESFENAKKCNFHGSTVLIPNTEDFILLLLNNGFDNIIYSKPFYKNVSWLLYCIYFIKNNIYINWNVIIQTAKKMGILAKLKIMLELFDCFLPNTIPNNLIVSMVISNEEQKSFNLYTRNQFLSSKTNQLKEEIRSKKISDFFYVIKLLIRFIYLKTVQKIPMLDKLLLNKSMDWILKYDNGK